MKSSAMRDLMAITERPEVISLAGGLPDTSTFPAESLRRADGAASPSTRRARALQYGPTEGLAAVKACIAEVMAAEGTRVDPEDLLVTTGGQQVIDLVCKTLVDPGDVSSPRRRPTPAPCPTFSVLPGRRRADRDGRRRHARSTSSRRRSTASTREGRRPKFIYTIPTFQNPAGVTMSLPRRRRLVEIAARARAARARGQPVRPAALRGRPAADAATRSTAASSSSTSGRSRRSSRPACALGWAAAPAAGAREDEPRQAGRRPVLVVADAALRRRLLRAAAAGRTTCDSLRDALPPPARHDARRARRALPARGDVDAPAGRAVHLGDAARLHRHDRPAGPRAARATSRSCPAARRTSTAAAARRCG